MHYRALNNPFDLISLISLIMNQYRMPKINARTRLIFVRFGISYYFYDY